MANSNVRFYKLSVLPNFEAKHKGIFVHVTGIMNKTVGKGLWMTPPDKDGGNVGRIDLEQWLKKRLIDSIESGLWFGGENGWELLSNDTTSGAIDAAIDAKIQGLDVGPYAQATINTTTDSSTLTIKGIKEADGKIGIPVDTENRDLNIAIDGVYNESSNKIATKSTVTKAIEALDSEGTIQAVTTAQATDNNANTVLTFNGIKEVDGKIAQGDGTSKFTVGDAKLKIQIGSNENDAFEVFSANKQSDSTIQLNGYVFKKDGDVISVITPTPVASDNKLVTQQDIANISGAMHYKGALTGAQSGDGAWPTTVAAGDVYIATGNFVKDGNTIESGDLIVFNSATLTDYKVVQSNITLGTDDGQVAANVGALADGKLVVGVNPAIGNKGIKTIDITESDLTGTTGKNERKLTYINGAPDTTGDITLYHSTTINDTFKVIGKDFSKSINILSNNRSIEITRNVGEDNSTGVIVDLVWNTSMDPDQNN